MKFCSKCQSHMVPVPEQDSKVIFNCGNCNNTELGTPEDSMFSEKLVLSIGDRERVLIERSSHDLAGNIVTVPCPDCYRQYMTLVRVDEKTLLHCICGKTIVATKEMIDKD